MASKVQYNPALYIIISIVLVIATLLSFFAYLHSRNTYPKFEDIRINTTSNYSRPTATPTTRKYNTYEVEKFKVYPSMDIKMDLQSFPTIDSSTSNQHIVSKTFCELTGVTCDLYEYEGEKFYSINSKTLSYKEISKKIKMSKTHDAYLNLIKGDVDIILVASLPSDDEQAEALKQGVTLSVAPIAKDAFIFMNNTSNSVTDLSSQQIKDIYSGKITNWNDVGGNDEKINAYVRGKNSGSQEMMKVLVMKDRILIESEEMMIETMMGLINKLTKDYSGIGYSFFYYKNNMISQSNVRVLSIDGIDASQKNITNGKYPFVTEVYVVTRKNDTSKSAQMLKQWFMTKEGQDLIEEVGYVKY